MRRNDAENTKHEETKSWAREKRRLVSAVVVARGREVVVERSWEGEYHGNEEKKRGKIERAAAQSPLAKLNTESRCEKTIDPGENKEQLYVRQRAERKEGKRTYHVGKKAVAQPERRKKKVRNAYQHK